MAFTHWKYVFLLIMKFNLKIILQIPKILLHLTFNVLAYILGYVGYFYMNMINIFIIVTIKEHKKQILYNTCIKIWSSQQK